MLYVNFTRLENCNLAFKKKRLTSKPGLLTVTRVSCRNNFALTEHDAETWLTEGMRSSNVAIICLRQRSIGFVGEKPRRIVGETFEKTSWMPTRIIVRQVGKSRDRRTSNEKARTNRKNEWDLRYSDKTPPVYQEEKQRRENMSAVGCWRWYRIPFQVSCQIFAPRWIVC